MPQVNTEKHTRISKTKVKKFETEESLFPTVSFQVGSSPSPLTVNRGRGQRIGRVPSWQENYLFATIIRQHGEGADLLIGFLLRVRIQRRPDIILLPHAFRIDNKINLINPTLPVLSGVIGYPKVL